MDRPICGVSSRQRCGDPVSQLLLRAAGMKQRRPRPPAVPICRVRRKLFHPEGMLLQSRTHIPLTIQTFLPTKPFIKSAKSNTADLSGTRHRAPVRVTKQPQTPVSDTDRAAEAAPRTRAGATPRTELGSSGLPDRLCSPEPRPSARGTGVTAVLSAGRAACQHSTESPQPP